MQTSLSTVAALGKLISGIQAHQPNGVFLVDGKSVTAAQAVAILQALVNAINALISAHAAVAEAHDTVTTISSANQSFVRDLRQNLQMLYAQSAATLSDFGLAPRKRAVLTPAQMLAAATKAAATRTARHAMGSKQKAAITGTTPAAATEGSGPGPRVGGRRCRGGVTSGLPRTSRPNPTR